MHKNKISNFRDLKVWQQGKSIVIETYKLSQNLPKHETYGLVSQMRRAAISIISNIAEGYNRQKTGEYTHFLNYALGSCAELETQIEISHDLGYINSQALTSLNNIILHESRMLKKLSSNLRNSKKPYTKNHDRRS